MAKRKSYNKMRVRLDSYTGEVNLKISFHTLRELLNGATINAYDMLKSIKNDNELSELQKERELSYYNGKIHTIKAIEALIDHQLRPFLYEDTDCVDHTLTKVQRLVKVKEEIKERKLLESLVENALKTLKVPKPKGSERKANVL